MRFTRRRIKTMLGSAALLLAVGLCLAVPPGAGAATWLSALEQPEVPARLAVDSQGNLYVTEPRNQNRLLVFDRAGSLTRTLPGLSTPGGVAVDASGNIYIASNATKTVTVYNPDLTVLRKLGKGDGEFASPNAVAVAPDGRIYVADSRANTIRVYNPDGAFSFTFGGYGKASGKFNIPIDLAVDAAAGELYVTDMGIFTDPQYGDTSGARVQVFDLAGAYKRSFGEYGTGSGKMIRALGLTTDGRGKVYVADGLQSVVHVFDSAGTPVETLYNLDRPMKTPIGLAVTPDGRLYVASSNTGSIEVYALDHYTSMAVAPSALSFNAIQGGPNPAAQTLMVSNSGTGVLSWTAALSPGAPWLSLLQLDGATGPGASTPLDIAVVTSGLPAGTYTGAITITAQSGASQTVTIELTIAPPPPVLSLTPASLSFTANTGGPAQQQSLTIANLGGGQLTWTAAASATWLTLQPEAGTVIVTADPAALATGTHSGSVTITAPGATGSPTTVPVTLLVQNATGTVRVSASHADAAFTLSGPAVYSGSGALWENSSVPAGAYTITYSELPGHKPVAPQTFTLAAGGTVELTATYIRISDAARIIAGSAADDNRKVVVITPAGAVEALFEPFASASGVRTAAVDLDGDGIDEIIVTDGRRMIKALSPAGAEIASFQLPEGSAGTVITAAPRDADGKAALIVGAEQNGSRTILQLAYSAGSLTAARTLVTETSQGAFTLAAVDLTGDRVAEIIIADAGSLRAYTVRSAPAALLWELSGDFGAAPELAARDLDGDGIPEIAMSRTLVTRLSDVLDQKTSLKSALGATGNAKSSLRQALQQKTGWGFGAVLEKYTAIIEIISADGRPGGVLVQAESSGKKPSGIALGDLDGDAKPTILLGSTGSDGKSTLINLYTSDGSPSGSIAVPDLKQGVHISVGVLK